jgi:hypothetical protein
MPTARHSSIWDRLTNDQVLGSGEDATSAYFAWLDLNYPAVVARDVNGSYVDPFDAKRKWGINMLTLGYALWLNLSGDWTNTEARESFSLSDHEALQMLDARDWIDTPAATEDKIARFNVFMAYGYIIGQDGITDKADVYSKFGIRADVASG